MSQAAKKNFAASRRFSILHFDRGNPFFVKYKIQNKKGGTMKKIWALVIKYYPIVRDFIIAILAANEVTKL